MQARAPPRGHPLTRQADRLSRTHNSPLGEVCAVRLPVTGHFDVAGAGHFPALVAGGDRCDGLDVSVRKFLACAAGSGQARHCDVKPVATPGVLVLGDVGFKVPVPTGGDVSDTDV